MPVIADANLTGERTNPTRRSLRLRILVALLLVFALGFGNLAIHLYGTRDELRRTMLELQAHAVTEGIRDESDMSRLPLSYAGEPLGYTLYSAQGELLWFSENLDRPSRLRTAMLEQGSRWWRWSPIGGRVINVPVRLPDGATLMVTRNDAKERGTIDRLLLERLRQSLLIMLPLGLLSVLLILWLLNWTLRPVRRAADLAASIGPGELNRRIPLTNLPVEIRPLADAANRALDRLAEAFAGERRFVADAAHELRTPLTVLDLRMQEARESERPDWPALEREMRQMRRLVGQLLELARQEGMAGTQQRGEQTSRLSRVIRESVASMLPLFEARDRELSVDVEDGLVCRGNHDELREVMLNVLENALLHGAGTVRVRGRKSAGNIVIEVCDQGEGVAQDQREAMFQRFSKGRQGSEGTGLGLAIVRRIVENAGGRVAFVDGQASTLSIVLPLTQPADAHQ